MDEFEQHTGRMTVEESLEETKVRMTPEMAILTLRINQPPTGHEALCEAYDMAINALHEQSLANETADIPEGTQEIRVVREMIVKIKTVAKMTRRQYTEGAITDKEAAELFEKYLPEEWGVDSVKMLDMTDTIQEG